MKKRLLIIISIAATMVFASCSTKQAEDVADTATEHVEDVAADVHDHVAEKMEVKTIKLEETVGEFTTKELNLVAGQEYLFEVTNNGIDKEVAFLLAPASLKDETVENIMAGAVTDAMLTKYVNNGEVATSKAPVKLEAGEYFYFCPLNATPQYKVTVK